MDQRVAQLISEGHPEHSAWAIARLENAKEAESLKANELLKANEQLKEELLASQKRCVALMKLRDDIAHHNDFLRERAAIRKLTRGPCARTALFFPVPQ